MTAPALIAGLAYLADFAGYHWNLHGDGILLFLVFFFALTVGLVLVCIALSTAFRLLRRFKSERTAINYLCAGVAFIYASVAFSIVGWAIKLALSA